ncbi:hypothetical protein KP79_PYT16801 [Mizuhopecten yessoensis]|uniref:Uncharacterized protein n=1 Tax=Mizuhopecten yessoensis TaxID=6573 RepID=A0A210PIZ5_MIZYE|nr:hypothetical protein KP79_PYT16801 [Mizuhopecten yessoensis]
MDTEQHRILRLSLMVHYILLKEDFPRRDCDVMILEVLGHRAPSSDWRPNPTTQFFNSSPRSMVHRIHRPMNSP